MEMLEDMKRLQHNITNQYYIDPSLVPPATAPPPNAAPAIVIVSPPPAAPAGPAVAIVVVPPQTVSETLDPEIWTKKHAYFSVIGIIWMVMLGAMGIMGSVISSHGVSRAVGVVFAVISLGILVLFIFWWRIVYRSGGLLQQVTCDNMCIPYVYYQKKGSSWWNPEIVRTPLRNRCEGCWYFMGYAITTCLFIYVLGATFDAFATN